MAAAWLVARKDLEIEFRTRTAFFSAMVFSILAIAIFYFAWDASVVSPTDRVITKAIVSAPDSAPAESVALTDTTGWKSSSVIVPLAELGEPTV